MKAVSFGVNYLFADFFELNVGFVYAAAMLVDFAMGYFINRFYVFNTDSAKSHKQVMSKFIAAGLSFRALNWLIYMGILKQFEVYILLAQLVATIIVLVMKYFVYRLIF